MARRWAALRMV